VLPAAGLEGAFDPRVMVPFSFDPQKQLFGCAGIIGIRVAYGDIRYDKPPAVTVTTDGKPVSAGSVNLAFVPQEFALAIAVVEEVWLRTPVTREQFRKLCDENRTHEKIRAALAKLP